MVPLRRVCERIVLRFRRSGAACLAAIAWLALASPSAWAAEGNVTLSSNQVGTTPRYIGYNAGHYMPGSNTSAWVEFSGANAMRLFTSATQYEPIDDLRPFGDGVTSLATFNARKDALRSDPLNTSYILWPLFESQFANHTLNGINHIRTNYAMGELQKLGVHILPVSTRSASSGPISGPSDWAGQWEQWQYYYAFSFYTAREFDVSQFQMYNEPNLDSHIDQAGYVLRLQLASDAIRSAIADVNRIYGKNLTADIAAPVTAGGSSRVDDWGRAVLEAIRTDYQGQTVDYDIFNTYAAQIYGRTGPTIRTTSPACNPRFRCTMPVERRRGRRCRS